MKATFVYYSPKNETIITSNGFCYYDTTSVPKKEIEIECENEIEMFEEFYKSNNKLRYCNGSYLKFKDMENQKKYTKWLESDDYKEKSFKLYYGNGVVD